MSKLQNEALKNLIMQAKMRMKEGLYKGGNNLNKLLNLKNSKGKYLADYKLKLIDDAQEFILEEKIKSVLTSEGIVINPINQIIDKDYYEKLDDISKSRYIINLSQKFKKFKEKFEKPNFSSERFAR